MTPLQAWQAAIEAAAKVAYDMMAYHFDMRIRDARKLAKTIRSLKPPAEISDAPGIPEEWKLVPVEPTQAMLDAVDSHVVGCCNMTDADAHAAYTAMLSAAPQPPEGNLVQVGYQWLQHDPMGRGTFWHHRQHYNGSTSQTSRPIYAATQPPEPDLCPVCSEPLRRGDVCATDIEMGTCHAECLRGSPAVDLETGEPSDGPISTYPYEPDEPQPPEEAPQ